jgi:hypothetical protein
MQNAAWESDVKDVGVGEQEITKITDRKNVLILHYVSREPME